MPVLSIVLLLFAAVLHALSNALIKLARDKLAFTWWMLTAWAVIGFPLIFFVGQPPPIGWLIIFVSGLIEAVYFITLTRAYALGDLSQVYPIARGSAPLFVLLWAMLFLGERPTPIGVGGIVIVVIGLYLVNLPALSEWKRPLLGFKSAAARWALLTGLLISIYSAIDKVGVRYVDPLPYLYLFLVVTWIAAGGAVVQSRSACGAARGVGTRYAESRAARCRRRVVGCGRVRVGVGGAEVESGELRKSGTRIERGDRRVDWRAIYGRTRWTFTRGGGGPGRHRHHRDRAGWLTGE